MNRQEWLIKMEKKGIANKIFMIINGKGFTPEEIAKNEFTSSIPAHGTSVYFVKSVLKSPQLLATSRHITGAVSIKKLAWNQQNSILSGSSQIPEGEPYSIFIHVPEGMAVSKVDADREVLFHKMTDSVLEVKFASLPEGGDENIINWTVEF